MRSSARQWARLARRGIITWLRAILGNNPYRNLRAFVVEFMRFRRVRSVPRGRRSLERELTFKQKELSYSRGVLAYPLGGRMPEEIRVLNLMKVTDALSGAGIDWFMVRNDAKTRYTVAVMEDQKSALADVLASSLRNQAVYVADAGTTGKLYLVAMLSSQPDLLKASVLRFGSFFQSEQTDFTIGLEYACDVEFWHEAPAKLGTFVTPRRNAAAQSIGSSDLSPAAVEIADRELPTLSVFKRRMLDDVAFPIDAVYTWVDGDDPEWLERKRRYEAEDLGNVYHPEANHSARFRSRDELKYSLRSLEMYAPWFRNVFLVTNGQVPAWLRKDHPKIRLVTHEDIYGDLPYLPTFNSNSIISRLHHIPDLSEHYVYINDDVFFGRAVSPEQFFLPNGIAKVSQSNNRRPFGESAVSDEPHINLTRNIRRLIENEFGITISRAIKHTPHPQLRSVHFDMERRFTSEYHQTWKSRFRHHDDIVADQLFHYYAQIAQKAVPGNLRYNYINVLDSAYEGTMMSMLLNRDRDCFCLNDAPVEGAVPLKDEQVLDFLDRYFPVKSSFEL
ncbi:Stealth protein CR4, conserved region 4 [Arthrobacter sp. VKM Ac-2550]|nr:Stealth protein CR4, conserved region 4 [Arthrobacter sp. VKM Ac-2550]